MSRTPDGCTATPLQAVADDAEGRSLSVSLPVRILACVTPSPAIAHCDADGTVNRLAGVVGRDKLQYQDVSWSTSLLGTPVSFHSVTTPFFSDLRQFADVPIAGLWP